MQVFKLVLPALLPSWRFFDTIAPSPRVEFTLLEQEDELPDSWQEFRPRPGHLTLLDMLCRLFWNPRWNETLYVMSCAERLMENPTQHSEDQILQRIRKDMTSQTLQKHGNTNFLQFRLLIVDRDGDSLQNEITYYSRIEPISLRDTA